MTQLCLEWTNRATGFELSECRPWWQWVAFALITAGIFAVLGKLAWDIGDDD